MQAGRFISLVKNVTDLRPEELLAVKELANNYPYSQLLHLIIARASRDQKTTDEKATLNRAAVYATDRTVLKAVMTREIQPRVEVDTDDPKVAPLAETSVDSDPAPEMVTPETKKKSAPKIETSKSEEVKQASALSERKPEIPLSQEIPLEGDALRSDLKKELNRLHELMGAFDATYEKIKKGEPTPPAPPIQESSAQVPPKPGVKKPSANPPVIPEIGSAEAPLIEEIKTSKRKPKMVSPKVAEQGEIIDQFIKVAPTLPRTKPTEPTTDLSVESVNIADNIVSETLVEILLKQGKKEKAIEMLKKLIWKFPQKKAYFAAQIEALKS